MPPEEEMSNRLSLINKNVQHLLELINELLDFSKMEHGQLAISPSQGDIVAYTQDLITRFMPLIEIKDQHLQFESNPSQWITSFDQSKWNKIIYNLLSNAIKFTPKGGKISIRLIQKSIHQKPTIYLTVKDTGRGIPPERVPHIFDRFYHVDPNDTQSTGTGIGLALVKELVELQEGTISVESKTGEGTTFSLQIPQLTNDEVEIESPESSKAAIIPAAQATIPIAQSSIFQELIILIIDDHADIRSCIPTHQDQILEATNGLQGIEKAIQYIPDLIICDVMMPEKDGFQVVQLLRQDHRTSHIPIILLTAKSSLDSKLKGLHTGADAFLTKPFNRQELLIRIKQLIEIRSLIHQQFQQAGALKKASVGFSSRKEDEFMFNFQAIIQNHLDEKDLNAEKISKHLGMSRTQLYRKVKMLTGKSIGEIILKKRLERSMVLLDQSSLSIAEIAYKVGFSSAGYFSKVFKKQQGYSPSEVRNNPQSADFSPNRT